MRYVENRMVDISRETYGSGAGNRKLWKKSTVSGSWAEVYLYGLGGEVLEVFRGIMGPPLEWQTYAPTQRAWFGGRLMRVGSGAVNADRLGTYQGTYPYGELQGTVGAPGEKFATYFRDGTGLDYAVNRYYSSQMGRFLSADPYQASGGPANPGSWNRYAYVEGDPVNLFDPGGLQKWQITLWGRFCGWRGAPGDSRYGCFPWSLSSMVDDGDISGGSGGGGGDGKKLIEGLQKGMRSNAISAARKALNRDDCRSIYNVGGRGWGPIALLDELSGDDSIYGVIRYGYIDKLTTSATTQELVSEPETDIESAALITLNDNTGSNWFLGNEVDRTLTILHELAHAYDVIYGAGSSLLPMNEIEKGLSSDEKTRRSMENTSE